MFPPAAFSAASSTPLPLSPDRYLALSLLNRVVAPSLFPRRPPLSLSLSPRFLVRSFARPPALFLSRLRSYFGFRSLALFPPAYKPCVAIYIKRRSVSLRRFAGTRASASGLGEAATGAGGGGEKGLLSFSARLSLRRGENHPKIRGRERQAIVVSGLYPRERRHEPSPPRSLPRGKRRPFSSDLSAASLNPVSVS